MDIKKSRLKRCSERLWSAGAMAAALLSVTALAHAQYVWTDEKGLKVFSDRPPPVTVPLNHILKSPGSSQNQANQQASDQTGDTAAAADRSKAAPSVAEQEAAYRKRKAEEATKEQKASADAKRQSDIASNCDSMRKDQTMLQSGIRVSTIGASGDRTYMSDDERSAKLDKIKQGLADCK